LPIASTTDPKEKNEIFVEIITSTTAGALLGYGVTIFLISNPIGWGTAIVLAVGSVAVSYGLGKSVRYLYGTHGKEIDLVEGTGIDRICQ